MNRSSRTVRLLLPTIAAGILLLASCAAPGPSRTSAGAKKETREALKIYDSGAPDCPYDVVGRVTVETEGSSSEYNFGARQRYLTLLRREAERRNCDAVIDIEASDTSAGNVMVTGTMIKFLRADCRR